MLQRRLKGSIPVAVSGNGRKREKWTYVWTAPRVSRGIAGTVVSIIATISGAIWTTTLVNCRIEAVEVSIGRGTLFIASSAGFSTGVTIAAVCLGGLVSCLTLPETESRIEGHGSKFVRGWFSDCKSSGNEK